MSDLALERCPEHNAWYREDNCWRVINFRKVDASGQHPEFARHVSYFRAMAFVTGKSLAELYRDSRQMDIDEWNGIDSWAE